MTNGLNRGISVMRFRKTLTFALTLALAAGLLTSAWAQISTGSIYGKVTDEQSAALPGATVTLTGATIGARTTHSGSGGEFRFLNLDPGTYTVAVSLRGQPASRAVLRARIAVAKGQRYTAYARGLAAKRTTRLALQRDLAVAPSAKGAIRVWHLSPDAPRAPPMASGCLWSWLKRCRRRCRTAGSA